MKNILCITSHDLNAPDYGAVLRCRNVFRMLSRFGHVRMVLGSRYENVIKNAKSPQAGFDLVDKIQFRPGRSPLLERVGRKLKGPPVDIEGYHASRRDRERLERLMSRHDLTWVHGLEITDAFNFRRWPKTVLDVDDLPSAICRLRLTQPDTESAQYWNGRKMKAWRRVEQSLARRFDAVSVCSELDRHELGATPGIFVLPNGFERPRAVPQRNPAVPPQIGFVGTFLYAPNRDGLRWFVDNVWPDIQEKVPGVRLRVTGERSQSSFIGRNVDALGWVEDMETEMANWSLAIVPLFVGGGTRIKILDAFSRKCPVVSTTLGAYGYDVENGRELLMADSPRAFTDCCLRILADPAQGVRLAGNAWAKFLQNWTWDSQSGRLAEILGTVWENSLPLETRDVAFDVPVQARKTPARKIAAAAAKSSPLVSVVIPAFNRAHCVADAVRSVLAQSFQDFEIIAVDDGSSDGTSEALEQFGGRIRLIRQENRGVSAARNTGIRAARGDWIAFLDSDDRWHPDKLERQVKAMEKFGVKICFARCVNTDNEVLKDIEFVSASLCEPEVFHVQNAVDSVCLSPRHPLIPTMVVEKQLLEKAGLFDESFHAAEDADLIFRLSFLSGYLYLDRPLATVYEKSENSLTYCEKLGPLARRNQSYLRMVSQMYWRLAEISPEKLSVMRARLGYFISRRAEIACAAGQLPVARSLARDGIFFARTFRDFARCAGILLFPGVVRSRAQRKWPA